MDMGTDMRKVLIAAGGTGGHMFPAQALAENLHHAGWNVAMITDERGRKHAGNIPASPIIDVEAASISMRRPLKAAGGAFKLAKGVVKSKMYMQQFRPDVAVGFGGYAAFPAMRAARSLGIPIILHEQNAVLGRVNRAFAAKAHAVASGFELLTRAPKGTNHIWTGNPLRGQIMRAVPRDYFAPDDGGDIYLLIVGGSLGAKIVSETVPAAIALLPTALQKRLVVVQQTREEYMDAAKDIYKACGVRATCAPFFTDIEQHLAKAHYVIARAGASSVSEIAVMGKPSLLVPLAIAMDDHQTVNAQTLKGHDAADILPESQFTAEGVKTTLMERLNDSHWLQSASASARLTARPDAASKLAELVADAAQK